MSGRGVRLPPATHLRPVRWVQQMSTATYPPGTDLMRPKQALDLRQRPASTSMQLVHTEVIASHLAKAGPLT